MTPQVYLKPGKEARVLAGHPWVFRSDIDRAQKEANPGDVVRVIAAKGRFLGQAVYNPHSMITLRMLSNDETPVDRAFVKTRVREAIALRRQVADLDCCRLIFAESDRLPAVIADKFGDVISLQILSLGMARFQEAIVEALVEELSPQGIWERNDVPVRELEGMMEKSVILSSFDNLDQSWLRAPQPSPKGAPAKAEKAEPLTIAPLKDMESEMIQKVLRQTGGNMQESARILGISRTSLWRKLQNQ